MNSNEPTYKCPVCKEQYDFNAQSEIDGYTDMCLPCACEKSSEDDIAKEKAQLIKWCNKTGLTITYDGFFSACFAEEIEESSLKGFPRLREIFEWCKGIVYEQNNYNEIEQPDLFTSISDLPF